MTSDFTKGPWYADGLVIQSGNGYDGEQVAVVVMRPGDGANARLIAAAPDMYEALQDCFAAFDPLTRDCRCYFCMKVRTSLRTKVEAALAKAEGKS